MPLRQSTTRSATRSASRHFQCLLAKSVGTRTVHPAIWSNLHSGQLQDGRTARCNRCSDARERLAKALPRSVSVRTILIEEPAQRPAGNALQGDTTLLVRIGRTIYTAYMPATTVLGNQRIPTASRGTAIAMISPRNPLLAVCALPCMLISAAVAEAAADGGNPSSSIQVLNEPGCPIPPGVLTAPKKSQPRCGGYTFGFTTTMDSTDAQFLGGKYKKRCSPVSGEMRCYWLTGKTACDAWFALLQAKQPGEYINSSYKIAGNPDENWLCQACDKPPNGMSPPPGQCTQYGTSTSLEKAPRAADFCFQDVQSVYKNCPDTFVCKGKEEASGKPGYAFTKGQKERIYRINKNENNLNRGSLVRSNLAGFKFPKPTNQECEQEDMTHPGPNRPRDQPRGCIEPTELDRAKTGIHHVVPRVDLWGCPCGTNSLKNAIVISRQLNIFLSNSDRPTNEILRVNFEGTNMPYACVP